MALSQLASSRVAWLICIVSRLEWFMTRQTKYNREILLSSIENLRVKEMD
jgi:hypothetical protein